MANRAKAHNEANRDRQISYLRSRIVMLPTLREEKEGKSILIKRRGDTIKVMHF